MRFSGGFAMPLQRGEVLGYDFNRMVVDFTMFNQGKTVRCAISTAAMDDLEGKHDVKADQRVDQFLRLRDAIEERACVSSSNGQPITNGDLARLLSGDPAATGKRAKIHVIKITDRKLSRDKAAVARLASLEPHAADPQC